MSGAWFDAVVAVLVQARTRRAMLGALRAAIAVPLAGSALMAGAGRLGAASQCRGKRSKCRRNGQCCSGRCRKRRGKSKGSCRCSRYLEPCRKSRDCCRLNGVPLVCASGTCQT